MELHGVVREGVIVPDDSTSLPAEGTRVRFEKDDDKTLVKTDEPEKGWFAKRFAKYLGVITDAPDDLAQQHDHYLYGTPKR